MHTLLVSVKRRTSAGGAAGAAGHRYAARVAAFHAVTMLAEQSAVLGWEVPRGTSVQAVAAETAAAVDDIRLTLSDDTEVLLQAKRRVTAATGTSSPLAKTADEFVRQHGTDGEQPTPMVLVCGPRSSAPITEGLPSMLRRLRDEPPPDPRALVATNGPERQGWAAPSSVVDVAWEANVGAAPSAAELLGLLSRVHIEVLDVEDGGRDEQRALDRLADIVLVDAGQASAVWRGLIERMLGLAAGQRGIVRARLQAVLAAEGVQLGVARSLRGDVARLQARTMESRERLARHRTMRLGADSIEIGRDAREPLRAAATNRCFAVVGAPGVGKSGLLADLIDDLVRDGVDVVALRAEDWAARTADELRRELTLEHGLSDVLAGWPGRPGVVIIDGLDAARGADATHTLITLVEDICAVAPRWRVVVSVRSFDLRYNRALRAALPGSAVYGEGEPEFADISHFAAPPLTDGELARLGSVAPALDALVAQGTPQLRSLVRNPFNLSLLAELATVHPAERLTGLVTQLELLALYWTTVATAPVDERAMRESVLRALCTVAGRQLALQVPRGDVVDEAGGDDAGVLAVLRAGVLVEHRPVSNFGQDRLGFSHNLLFDYAFGRMVLADGCSGLADQLRHTPEVLLLVRPSLVLRLEDVWARGAGDEEFWRCALLLSDEAQGVITRLVAPAVAAANLETIEELAVLLERVDGSAEPEALAAAQLLYEVVAARMAAGPSGRPLSSAAPDALAMWAELASRLVDQPLTRNAGRWLLWALWREATE